MFCKACLWYQDTIFTAQFQLTMKADSLISALIVCNVLVETFVYYILTFIIVTNIFKNWTRLSISHTFIP